MNEVLYAEHAPPENDQEPSLLCPGRNPGIAAAPSADDATRLYSTPSNRTQLRHGCNLRRSLFHLKVRCREKC